MKKITTLGFFLCLLSVTASAQTKEPKKKSKQEKPVLKTTTRIKKGGATTLSNTTDYPAFAPATGLRFADPTINRFNQKAAGTEIPVSSPGVAGIPKGSYGFANGHLLLRNTTATSSGTGYGSGAVGTGTSIQGLGTSEATLGVNGKSPYAGSWLWGDKQPLYPSVKMEKVIGKKAKE